MIWPWYIGLVVVILFYWVSVTIHELGHRKRARMLGYQSKIYWRKFDLETHWWGRTHNDKDDISIIYWGIIPGLTGLIIPIILIDYIGALWVLWLCFAYGWGCKHDLKLLKQLEERITQ